MCLQISSIFPLIFLFHVPNTVTVKYIGFERISKAGIQGVCYSMGGQWKWQQQSSFVEESVLEIADKGIEKFFWCGTTTIFNFHLQTGRDFIDSIRHLFVTTCFACAVVCILFGTTSNQW